ncbi:unnamed protein product [Diplocarpon coronariae]|uniref:Uncharacterized protein n=1 Tax=Diplocarpon coronariae TaxID=2795749 RepID=A0A218Z2V9_9HELO|nr:hypothetical protein B2J93_3209 [Marssonina coronariae]
MARHTPVLLLGFMRSEAGAQSIWHGTICGSSKIVERRSFLGRLANAAGDGTGFQERIGLVVCLDEMSVFLLSIQSIHQRPDSCEVGAGLIVKGGGSGRLTH